MTASDLWVDSNQNCLVLPGLKPDQNTLRCAQVRSNGDTAPHVPLHFTGSKKGKDCEDTLENGKLYRASIFVTNLLGMRSDHCLCIHVLLADGSGMPAGQGSSSRVSAPVTVPDGSSRGCAVVTVL